ncbi:hypothetical protein LI328DRAFT_81944 [Trichoderma asperelloides]|nr:hypothetical protein LI328DRAFT_81944 [Trichoderma asperelloides]
MADASFASPVFLLSTFPPCSISRCQCHDSIILAALAKTCLLVMIDWSAAASIGFRDHQWLFIHLHRMTAVPSVPVTVCHAISIISIFLVIPGCDLPSLVNR